MPIMGLIAFAGGMVSLVLGELSLARMAMRDAYRLRELAVSLGWIAAGACGIYTGLYEIARLLS